MRGGPQAEGAEQKTMGRPAPRGKTPEGTRPAWAKPCFASLDFSYEGTENDRFLTRNKRFDFALKLC